MRSLPAPTVGGAASATPEALPAAPAPSDTVAPATKLESIEESWLYQQRYRRRVVESDNDIIVGIASASKSAISGTGKTTLGIRLLRDHLNPNGAGEWDAEEYAAISGHRLSHDLVSNQDVPDGTPLLADEMQGTLADHGVDARRHMANSVIEVTKALATFRYRGFPVGIIMQSASWMDQRLLLLLDALVLIQGLGEAHVYDYYQNDFTGQEYFEFKGRLTWDPLPADDPDYETMTAMKAETSVEDIEAAEDAVNLEDEKQDVREAFIDSIDARDLARDTKIRIIADGGVKQKEIAERFDLSQPQVSRIVNGESPNE